MESLDLKLTYDPTLFSPTESNPLISAGSLNPGSSFVVNNNQPGQVLISWAATSPLASGSGSIATLNLQLNSDAAPGTSVVDLVSASINEDAFNTSLQDGTLTLLPPSFQVGSIQQLPYGLALQLSEAPDLEALNLYDGPDSTVDAPDLQLTDSSGTAIALSAHWQESSQELILLADQPLNTGDYNLSIDSRADGLISASTGEYLDGDGDGTSGDAFSQTISFTAPEHVLSIANTARGAGQSLSVNARNSHDPLTGLPLPASKGLPIALTTASSLTSFSGQLNYDSSLLLHDQLQSALTAGAQLPDDWSIEIDSRSTPGNLIYSASGTTAISGSNQEILRFQGTVPTMAAPPARGTTGNGLYGSSTLINASISSEQLSGDTIAVDPGLVALAYSGDNTGNGSLSSLDASRVQRVVVGLDSGFDAYDSINPTLLGDTTGNGTLSSLDASRIQQQVVGLPVNSFPDPPAI